MASKHEGIIRCNLLWGIKERVLGLFTASSLAVGEMSVSKEDAGSQLGLLFCAVDSLSDSLTCIDVAMVRPTNNTIMSDKFTTMKNANHLNSSSD